MAVASNKIGIRLLEALGLPSKGCVSVKVIAKANDVVRVQAEYCPHEDRIEEVIVLIREFVGGTESKGDKG